MNLAEALDRLVQRFCERLGRYGSWSKWLDPLARFFCPSFLNPLLLPAAVNDLSPLHQPVLMAGRTSGQGTRYDGTTAPPPAGAPGPGDPGDPPHSTKECAPAIFHGMHGAPCSYHGGSNDNKWCPPGTVPGSWWRFNIPKIGNVYYVDCCGIPIKWKVWCRWAKEPNWCLDSGSSIYTCTLTLLHSELHRDPKNPIKADPIHHVLAGPPAPPGP